MKPVSNEVLLRQLNWRYATKKFDPTKKIPAADWETLEHALVLTPSSAGLQPWKFFVVTDGGMKTRLRPAAYQQSQTVDCSHFVVFTVRKDLGHEHVDRHVTRMAEVRGITVESLAKFQEMVTSNLDRARTESRLDTWQSHQLYSALGNFITSAALLGIDTCAMEGIDPVMMDEILGLKDSGYTTVVACAAGYRAADDKYATTKKVRFKPEDVIVRI
ncbi:MAG: NAD(P)H-dependent oxidoreductase [Opitutaceae bacterium]